MDSWQSTDSLSQLRKAGVNALEYSVDKTPLPYKTLKSAIYEGLFECYVHPVLIRELEELVELSNGKIDHPEFSNRRALFEDKVNRGSKDTADSVAAVAAQALERGRGSFSSSLAPVEASKAVPGVSEKQPPSSKASFGF